MKFIGLLPLGFIVCIFLGTLFTKLTMSYVFFGVLLLWTIRILFRKPDFNTALTMGFSVAFWAYLIYMLLGLLVFRTLCICPFVHVFGLIFVPVASGVLTAIVNLIPETEADLHKKDLIKDIGLKL